MTKNDQVVFHASLINYNCGRIDGLCDALRSVKHVNRDMKNRIITVLESVSGLISSHADAIVDPVEEVDADE